MKICDLCRKHKDDEYFFVIEDIIHGHAICENCINTTKRKHLAEYITYLWEEIRKTQIACNIYTSGKDE